MCDGAGLDPWCSSPNLRHTSFLGKKNKTFHRDLWPVKPGNTSFLWKKKKEICGQ